MRPFAPPEPAGMAAVPAANPALPPPDSSAPAAPAARGAHDRNAQEGQQGHAQSELQSGRPELPSAAAAPEHGVHMQPTKLEVAGEVHELRWQHLGSGCCVLEEGI
eukprot:1157442-Pelagomonas_calceolata.AAC.5